MEKFTEFQTYVLYLLTKEFSNGNYDSLKNRKKEIIALAKNLNYKEDYRVCSDGTSTVIKFYNDEKDDFLDYTIIFSETDKYNWPHMSITVRSKKKDLEVSFLK